jgi:hypothetical protein
MTSMARHWRRLHQIEDERRDLLALAADAAAASNERFHLGIPTDDDLEAFDPTVPSTIFDDLYYAFSNDKRTWSEQLAASPAERLALDAVRYQGDRAGLHDALQALRGLAATGGYHTKTGWKRATPSQRSHARILLRRLVPMIVAFEGQDHAPIWNHPTGNSQGDS